MQHYKNLNGNSGVAAYEIGNDNIKVQFNDGSVYLYTSRSAGSINIGTMKRLAMEGRGLNSFIKTHVNKNYEAKLR